MNRSNLISLALLLVSIPLGVAAQNAICLLVLIMNARRPKLEGSLYPVSLVLAPLVLTTHTIISTLMNAANPEDEPYIYFFGFLPIFFLPWFLIPRIKWQPAYGQKLLKLAIILCLIWTLAILSQRILGWSLHYLGGGKHYRPHGFFSHPLTLAYVALILWPWTLHYAMTPTKKLIRWIPAICLTIIIYFSQSRACQSIAFIILTWVVMTKVSGKMRWGILASIILCSFMVIMTDNPVSSRFQELIPENNPDRFSHYPADRLAFWDAHWQMIKERPILGHGMHLGLDYRKPYYGLIGLDDFMKQYEAHNQYLQIWANSGLIGLVIFLYWLAALIRYSRRLGDLAPAWRQMVLVFFLGSIVQNTFSDSEFRNAIMVMICFTGILANYHENSGKS